MFVDGDDWIEPDMCQTMYEAGETSKVQLVMCGIMKDYGKSSTEYKFYLEDGKVYQGKIADGFSNSCWYIMGILRSHIQN